MRNKSSFQHMLEETKCQCHFSLSIRWNGLMTHVTDGGWTNISFNIFWSFNINFFQKLLCINKEISMKAPALSEKVHCILCTCIYKTKLSTFPNIPVFSLHRPVLSTDLLLGNINLQMDRHSQTPPSSCHSCPTTILYILITKITTVLTL